MNKGIQLAPLLTDIRVNIKDFKTDMDKVATTAVAEAKKVSEDMEKTAKVGDKMKSIGEGATKYMTLPIIGAGLALGAMAADSENSLSSLQGKLGVTSEEAEKLKTVAKGVYNDGFGESLDSCVDGLVSLQQNLESTKNWSDETKQATLEQIMTINSLFGTETGELTKTLAVMQNSGLTDDIETALNVITVGFQKGGDYSGELLDTLREYSPQFVKLGLSADEAMNFLITGANNGAFNLDKVGDAMKEFSIRAIDGSKSTVEGFQIIGLNADEMAKKFAEGGESARGAFSEVVKAISNIDDPLKQSQAGVDLFGTMWEDLGPQVIISLASVQGGIDGVEDATKKAGEGINNNLGAQFTTALREAKDAAMPLATEVLKLAKDALPAVRDVIGDVSSALKNMSPETKQNIIKFAGLAAAIGPLINVTGSAITTFAKFKPIISGLSKGISEGTPIIGKYLGKLGLAKGVGATATEAIVGVGKAATTAGGATGLGALASGLGSAAIAAAPFALAIAGAGVVAYGVHKSLSEEVVPAVDLYADTVNKAADGTFKSVTKISDSTKTAVGAYMDMDTNVQKSLLNMKYNNTTVTEAVVTDLTTQYSNMGKAITTELDKDYNANYGVLQKFFSESSTLTTEEQANMMLQLQTHYTNEKTNTQAALTEIQTILTTASNEKRGLKTEEYARIDEINIGMKTSAVTALSDTEKESIAILARIKDSDGRLTAETAGEHVKTLEDQRIKTIEQAEIEYQERLRVAEAIRSEGGTKAEEAADKCIAAAELQRKETIDKANATKKDGIDVLSQSYTDLEKNVDTKTGKILDWWGQLEAWYDSWKPDFSTWFDPETVNLPKYDANGNYAYNGLSYVPTDGFKATLHKGERVLTAEENKEMTQGNSGSNGINQTMNFYGRVDSPYDVAKASKKALRDVRFA